jgi:hypothetical protein
VVARFAGSGKAADGSLSLITIEGKSPNISCGMHNMKDDRLVAGHPEISASQMGLRARPSARSFFCPGDDVGFHRFGIG